MIESLVNYDEGRTGLTSEEGCWVVTVEEVLENGTLQSREHAKSEPCKQREPILSKGVSEGDLLQSKAHTLLQLLRESLYPEYTLF